MSDKSPPRQRWWNIEGWGLRTKVTAVLAVPVTVAMVLGGLRVENELSNAVHFSSAADQVAVVPDIVDFSTAFATATGSAAAGTITPEEMDTLGETFVTMKTIAASPEFDEALVSDLDRTIASAETLYTKMQAGPVAIAEIAAVTSEVRDNLNRIVEAVLDGVDDREILDYGNQLVNAWYSQRYLFGQVLGVLAILENPEQPDTALVSASGGELAMLELLSRSYPMADAQIADLRSGVKERTDMVAAAGEGPLPILNVRASLLHSVDVYGGIIDAAAQQITTTIQDRAAETRAAALRDTAIVLAALLAALVLALLVSRSLVGPIRRLRYGTLKVARQELPEAIDRIKVGDSIEDIEFTRVPVHTTEEIGQLARAVDDMHGQALRLAGEQAHLRLQINDMFETLARRSKSLVEQQLGLIERLEYEEKDPSRLESLFRLDHLAARMRRNGDNLLILSGTRIRRGHSAPVQLGDILRAAMSEVEDYQRVQIGSTPDGALSGAVATDIVHLLAELVDNSLRASPPDSTVTFSFARAVDGGLLVEIADRGIGIPPEELEIINERLTSGGAVGPDTARHMGLFVVSRLAERHGLTVRLRPTFDTARNPGITASVHIPDVLLVSPLALSQTGPQPRIIDAEPESAPEALSSPSSQETPQLPPPSREKEYEPARSQSQPPSQPQPRPQQPQPRPQSDQQPQPRPQPQSDQQSQPLRVDAYDRSDAESNPPSQPIRIEAPDRSYYAQDERSSERRDPGQGARRDSAPGRDERSRDDERAGFAPASRGAAPRESTGAHELSALRESGVPGRPQQGQGDRSGLPTRQPGAAPGLPPRQPGSNQPGSNSGLPTRNPGAAASGLPTRNPGAAASGLPSRQPGTTPGLPTRQPGATPGLPTRQPGATPGLPTRQPGATSGLPQPQQAPRRIQPDAAAAFVSALPPRGQHGQNRPAQDRVWQDEHARRQEREAQAGQESRQDRPQQDERDRRMARDERPAERTGSHAAAEPSTHRQQPEPVREQEASSLPQRQPGNTPGLPVRSGPAPQEQRPDAQQGTRPSGLPQRQPGATPGLQGRGAAPSPQQQTTPERAPQHSHAQHSQVQPPQNLRPSQQQPQHEAPNGLPQRRPGATPGIAGGPQPRPDSAPAGGLPRRRPGATPGLPPRPATAQEPSAAALAGPTPIPSASIADGGSVAPQSDAQNAARHRYRTNSAKTASFFQPRPDSVGLRPQPAPHTPIFSNMMSDWLVDPTSLPEDRRRKEWRSAADAGWEAAQRAAEVSVEEHTTAGLPRREPGHRLVPGAVRAPATGELPKTIRRRDPEAIRANLSRHQQGVRNGRTSANTSNRENNEQGVR